ncbi:MAG: hypothetical protein J7M14_03165 [Planctomycetes bacterium]|nr:hypothetical protein [Planctomycetota bacterium]
MDFKTKRGTCLKRLFNMSRVKSWSNIETNKVFVCITKPMGDKSVENKSKQYQWQLMTVTKKQHTALNQFERELKDKIKPPAKELV